MLNTTKVCRRCGKEKPLKEFKIDLRYKDNFDPWCRDCKREYTREYRAKHGRTVGDAEKASQQKWKKDHRPEINRYYREVARKNKQARVEPPATKVCSICKEEKPAEEFDRNFRNKDTLYSYCKECKRAKYG